MNNNNKIRKYMDEKIEKEDDDFSEIPILREGLPTQWEIQKELGSNIFRRKSQMTQNQVEKDLQYQTGDISELDGIDIFEYVERPKTEAFQSFLEFSEILFSIQDKKSQLSKAIQDSPLPLKIKICQNKINKKKPTFKKLKNRKKKIFKRKQKNQVQSETKNIPKNYGKQIIKFIKKERQLTNKLLTDLQSNFTSDQLNAELKKRKKSINKIQDLRKLWLSQQYSKEFRILSQIFLRKHCLPWIFNSRMINISYPIKYRHRIMKGVQKPEEFMYIKDH